MSFSSDVKEELSRQVSKSRHCQLAELSAIICYVGKIKIEGGRVCLHIETENTALQEKYFTLLKKTFNIEAGTNQMTETELKRVLEGVKMWDAQKLCFRDSSTADGILLQQTCCRRAFIRGAFLSCGSMSNPNKSYHFEIVCGNLAQAKQLANIMNSFEVDAKIVARKKSQVVYVKEGAHIVDILNVMEAHVALMDLENVRIVKEMRNSVNRQVNCETANISKTVTASVRQIEDIAYIRDKVGLESLPDNLREIALVRIEYPDAALKELGTYLNPPVGKSGVNHRLRKLAELAEEFGYKRQ